MPINPNIALGGQQQQPVNMLGQMGQVMAIRQAQQQYEEQNALRDAFAQGADVNDPESFKRIASINPKLAMELRSKGIEQRQKQTEIGLKTNEVLGAALGGLVQNPTLDYAKATFSHLVSTGVLPPDKATAMYAKLEAEPNRIKEYATLGVQAAISATNKMQDATSRENARTTSGPGYLQAGIARERLTMEQQQQAEVAALMRGEAPTAAPATAAPVGAGGVPTGASAPTNALAPASAAAPTNALVTPNADPYAQISAIDAQIAQLINSGNPKAIPVAQALNAQRTQLLASAKQQFGGNLVDVMIPDPNDPKKTITIKGRQDQYGRVVPAEMVAPPLSTDASATGQTTLSPSVVRAPLTAGQERQAETARVKEEGQKTVNTVLSTLNRQYQGLVNEGGITDTSKSAISNLRTSATTNVAGQAIGGAVGSKAQQFRDSIEQTRPLLLNAIKNATGMSAQQLNSNVELQTYLKAATDPKLSIQANVEAMNNISKLFGLGEEFKIEPPAKKGKSAPANSSAPSSIDALLEKYK